jgi:phosphatidylserine decarboxylase
MKFWSLIKRVLFFQTWNRLPRSAQIGFSKIWSVIYQKKISQFFIRPFCKMNSLSNHYLDQFISGTGEEGYKTFQDFFTRKLRYPVAPANQFIWPCEGYVCEQGPVSELPLVKVKGETRSLKLIFDRTASLVPNNYFYTNIFLHSHNYHRIHAPLNGKITRIEYFAGDLSILRPWMYKRNQVSKPALRNERVSVDITDENGHVWFLSIVGGMAVGTIQLAKNVFLGQNIRAGEELAMFLLGSTCCMASPVPIAKKEYLDKVFVGQPLLSNSQELRKAEF